MIREYEEADLDAIFHINKSCFAQPQSNVGLLSEIHKGKCWVSDEGSVLSGFLIGQSVSGALLHTVAVLEEFRGNGIGAELLTTFQNFYKDCTLWLYVIEHNPAQKLYFDFGYRVRDVVKDYYYPDQSGLLMVKNPCI